MEEFFAKRVEKLFRLPEQQAQNAEKLALVVFPRLLLEIIRKYFRIEIQGLERLPHRGRVLIAPNHSGCAGFDAVMLGYMLNQKTGRIPRILTLWNFFKWFPIFTSAAEKMGLKAASTDNGVQLLRKNHMVVCFPEGEAGSFKPSSERYQLQQFKTGFVRMAILTRTPIVPCVILGAEEANINLGQLKLTRYVKPMLVPIPFNLIPLPSKWTIKFLEPIDLSKFRPEDAHDKTKMERLSEEIRAHMQKRVQQELRKRPYVFFSEAGAGV